MLDHSKVSVTLPAKRSARVGQEGVERCPWAPSPTAATIRFTEPDRTSATASAEARSSPTADLRRLPPCRLARRLWARGRGQTPKANWRTLLSFAAGGEAVRREGGGAGQRGQPVRPLRKAAEHSIPGFLRWIGRIVKSFSSRMQEFPAPSWLRSNVTAIRF
jgi:hypothetical protein